MVSRSFPLRMSRNAFAMAHGVAVEQLLDPEHTLADLFGEMLELFFTGLAGRAAGA